MTKINKLGKSTFVIAILSFLLVAVLAFGGTYAYFSAVAAPAETEITMGHLKIGTDGATWDTTNFTTESLAVPNQPIIGAGEGGVSVDIEANVRYFVRAKIDYTFELAKAHNGVQDEGETVADNCTCADKTGVELLLITATLAGTDEEGWIAGTATTGVKTNKTGYYYLNKVQDAEPQTESFSITAKVNPEIGQVSSQHFMDAVITVTVTFDVIQADYILGTDANNATTAVDDKLYTAAELEVAFERAGLPIVVA